MAQPPPQGPSVWPLYEMFLDLPHPSASASCPGPFIIPSSLPISAPVIAELEKNLVQIFRFAFPEYDESVDPYRQSPDQPKPRLNHLDVYAMQSKSFQSFTFSLQLGTGVRVHGHVRRYLPPHLVARCRYDVGRRGERALCILTRATGADLLYSSMLKTIEAISSQQAALPGHKMPHNGQPQKWYLYQMSRYQQHLANIYGNKPPTERGKPLIAAIPCMEIGEDVTAIYKDVDMSRFIVPTCLLHPNMSNNPKVSIVSQASGSILPLLRCVGVAHALRIMTALLSERRVIMVSASTTRLTSCSNAALSMLATGLLQWQHLYIPVLPPHLWQYLAAPYPYLIGVLSSVVQKLDQTDGLGEVLIIHLDSNNLETRGMDPEKIHSRIPDLFRNVINSLGGTMKNMNITAEALQQQMSGVPVSSSEMLAQDLFDLLKTDKKILYGVSTLANVGETAAKATAAVKNTFFKIRDKGRQYLKKSSSGVEDKMDKSSNQEEDEAAETLKAMEKSIASDYIYTEGCHNEVCEADARVAFTTFFLCMIGDMRWYLSQSKTYQEGTNLPVLDRAKYIQQKRALGEGEGTPMYPLLVNFCQTQMLEEFAKARIEEVKNLEKNLSPQITPDAPLFLQCMRYHRQHHIDFGMLNVKRICKQIAESNPGRLTGMLQTNARRTAMSLTSNKAFEGDQSRAIAQLVDQCRESTSVLFDVMSVIWLRLRDSKGMQWKHAYLALQILRNLLYHGPLAAVTEAVDGLDKIRALKYYDNLRPVSVTQIRGAAAVVYNLLVDRAKLFYIRRVCIERRRQIQFPSHAKRVQEKNARIGIPFKNIHALMHPNSQHGTVVHIPPKAPSAQTMVRDSQTPPQHRQQEVDFFAAPVSAPVQPSAPAGPQNVVGLFDNMNVSGPPAPASSNPFESFATPQSGSAPSSGNSQGIQNQQFQQPPQPVVVPQQQPNFAVPPPQQQPSFAVPPTQQQPNFAVPPPQQQPNFAVPPPQQQQFQQPPVGYMPQQQMPAAGGMQQPKPGNQFDPFA